MLPPLWMLLLLSAVGGFGFGIGIGTYISIGVVVAAAAAAAATTTAAVNAAGALATQPMLASLAAGQPPPPPPPHLFAKSTLLSAHFRFRSRHSRDLPSTYRFEFWQLEFDAACLLCAVLCCSLVGGSNLKLI